MLSYPAFKSEGFRTILIYSLKNNASGLALAAGVALLAPTAVAAQAVQAAPQQEATQLDEVIVTATKKGGGERVQDVPVAISAYGEQQLDAMQFRGLETIAYSAPNVQLNPIGTVKGTANFAIRGLGTNSSIPSLDPTVGVFVDGVYVGTSVGALVDGFDVAGIEILRGPQGILFGKNVTGGAVVIRTTTPRDQFSVNANASVESGPSYTTSLVVTGPVANGLSLKAAGYFNHDDGWFRNQADGGKYGGSETKIGRLAARYAPNDALELIGRYEIGDIRADDETPAQNRAVYSARSHDVAGSRNGGADIQYQNATLEANLDVAFGNGTVTNIFGWRKLETQFGLDVDALSARFFEQYQIIDQEQYSNELRYSGDFGPVSVVSGLYYFNQTIDYFETRGFGNGAVILQTPVGGGVLEQDTVGAFISADWKIQDTITLSVGGRYTKDSKDAWVSSIRPNGCNVATRTCNYDFIGSTESSGFTPRVGLSWQPDRDTLFFASIAKGLRGGGINIRNASPGVAPGPFGDEKVTAYEVGMKADFADGRLRMNTSIFRNEISDMQREVNTLSPTNAIAQVIENTADAVIQGVEMELTLRPTDSLTLTGNIGLTDGKYTRVIADINRDGVINAVDTNLDIPRLVPLTWGVGVSWDRSVSVGGLNVRANYAYRDASWFSDANTPGTKMREVDSVEASINLRPTGTKFEISLYGKNLLDEVIESSMTNLPAAFGGAGATYIPLSKGRVIGISVRYRY